MAGNHWIHQLIKANRWKGCKDIENHKQKNA